MDKIMKKILLSIIITLSTVSAAQAYYIGGKYFQLRSCDWGKWGYEFGYVGYYVASDGESYRVFFGNNYCQY